MLNLNNGLEYFLTLTSYGLIIMGGKIGISCSTSVTFKTNDITFAMTLTGLSITKCIHAAQWITSTL